MENHTVFIYLLLPVDPTLLYSCFSQLSIWSASVKLVFSCSLHRRKRLQHPNEPRSVCYQQQQRKLDSVTLRRLIAPL